METDLNKLRDRSYAIAKAHGFHEKEQSDETYLMLIISEVGEAVNADRKNHHANMPFFNRIITQDSPNLNDQEYYAICYKRDFETWIKDSVEDELSDVAIRLLDFAGLRKIDLSGRFIISYVVSEKKSFCENCYAIVKDITNYKYSLDEMLNYEVRQVIELAKLYSIDLFKFIDLKMRYNELRPYRNGKNY